MFFNEIWWSLKKFIGDYAHEFLFFTFSGLTFLLYNVYGGYFFPHTV